MKYLNLKWIFASLAITSVMFSACKKAHVDEQLLDQGQHIITFLTYGGASDKGFANANLSFDPSHVDEQMELALNYSTDQVADHDITVTVAYNPDALATFNADPANANSQYEKLPDSTYDFPTTTVVIRAFQSVSEPFFVTFHPIKIDGSVNYMLPLSITSITGAPADVKPGPSSGTAFLHFIGNPLAGFYDVVGTRYNYTTQVTWNDTLVPYPAGATPSPVPAVKFASALDAYRIQLDIAAIGAGVLDYEYIVKASNDYSSVTLDFNSVFLGASFNRVFFIRQYVPPNRALGIKPEFHIQLHYFNGTTGDRIMDEYFRHQ